MLVVVVTVMICLPLKAGLSGCCSCAGPSQQPVLQMGANIPMDASPAFMRVNQNESDTDWFQHNEPPVLGIADIFDHDQDIVM